MATSIPIDSVIRLRGSVMRHYCTCLREVVLFLQKAINVLSHLKFNLECSHCPKSQIPIELFSNSTVFK